MKFVAIMMIISGALSIPVGALYIWLGVILLSVANLATEAQTSGSERAFTEALEKIGSFFKISGITAIVGICLMIVFIAIYAVVIAVAISSGGGEGFLEGLEGVEP
ncbi:MAG: DUF5362 family protein [Verrucomicrobiota bacterium]